MFRVIQQDRACHSKPLAVAGRRGWYRGEARHGESRAKTWVSVNGISAAIEFALIPFHGIPIHVIRSFRCRETEALFDRRFSRRWHAIERVARRKLEQINAAAGLDDLRVPSGNRLEALRGDREGQYSIRINDQWRVCFRWRDADAHDVEIVDYH